jgi:hypothetical protein
MTDIDFAQSLVMKMSQLTQFSTAGKSNMRKINIHLKGKFIENHICRVQLDEHKIRISLISE